MDGPGKVSHEKALKRLSQIRESLFFTIFRNGIIIKMQKKLGLLGEYIGFKSREDT